MAVSRGLSAAMVVEAALAVIDEAGPGALTLAAVASRLGVASPSLYKHVESLAALRTLVSVRVLTDLTADLTAAAVGRSGDEALAALMRAYRAYVVRHPGRYAAMSADPLHDPDQARAAGQLLEIVFAVLRGYHLTGSELVHAARCLRVIAHGFASLEASGGFGLPEDIDETFEQLLSMFLRSLTRQPPAGGSTQEV